MSGQWARPFRVTYPDGIPEDEVLHGVQFSDRRCVLLHRDGGYYWASTFAGIQLQLGPSAVGEWADGGQP